jgi:hypothetical protein
VPQTLEDVAEIILEALVAMGLRVAQGEQNQKADRDREESEGEGVEPPEGCQDATDGRVARRANREDARVVAQRGRALLTVKMALMTVTLRVPRVTAPIPCSCRCAWCGPKPDAKARRPPMIPMRSRAGTRILRRLWRSGRTPSTGISATSGKVKMVVKSTPAHSLRLRGVPYPGQHRVMLATPRSAMKVTPKRRCRLWSL